MHWTTEHPRLMLLRNIFIIHYSFDCIKDFLFFSFSISLKVWFKAFWNAIIKSINTRGENSFSFSLCHSTLIKPKSFSFILRVFLFIFFSYFFGISYIDLDRSILFLKYLSASSRSKSLNKVSFKLLSFL